MKIKKLNESTEKFSKKLDEMTIGYDEKSIDNQIRILKNNIEDYEQLIVDEPEDKDYWQEMINKCQAEIDELKSYKPLDESTSKKKLKVIKESSAYEYVCPKCKEETADELESDSYGHRTFRCASCGYSSQNIGEWDLVESKSPSRASRSATRKKLKVIKEASYGGAFDIEDDQFFTREELNEFGYDVVDALNTISYSRFKYEGCYMENGVLELDVEWDGNVITAKTRVDMRKIRKPSDLYKACGPSMVDQLRKEFSDLGVDFGLHLRADDYPYGD